MPQAGTIAFSVAIRCLLCRVTLVYRAHPSGPTAQANPGYYLARNLYREGSSERFRYERGASAPHQGWRVAVHRLLVLVLESQRICLEMSRLWLGLRTPWSDA